MYILIHTYICTQDVVVQDESTSVLQYLTATKGRKDEAEVSKVLSDVGFTPQMQTNSVCFFVGEYCKRKFLLRFHL